MEKRIQGFDDYAITDKGEVISYKHNSKRKMKTFYQKTGYENIKLCKNGETYHKAIHRLVAEAFIPNPNNYPEVNHIDRNIKNNNITNLEWCTRQYNLEQSYETLGPTRNFVLCNLMYRDLFIKSFNSIKDAARYGADNYNCSLTSLERYHASKGYNIVCRD